MSVPTLAQRAQAAAAQGRVKARPSHQEPPWEGSLADALRDGRAVRLAGRLCCLACWRQGQPDMGAFPEPNGVPGVCRLGHLRLEK